MGKAALGKTLMRSHRDSEAEVQLTEATQIIEVIAGNLHTPRLRACFLNATPVAELYKMLGRRPPPMTS